MAILLADHQVRKLLGSVIRGADETLLNPNGIELRLGKKVRFISTGEIKELEQGMFLKVYPGETVIISSMEMIDFSSEAVNEIFPNHMLMGLITPTTTMMREGISQVATKIDAGFRGNLNWGLRNGSVKDLIIEYSEPIFKLTIFLLEGEEIPELAYGERETDSYQDTEGIKRSKRRIPADLSDAKMLSSSRAKIDPKKQLREAGYPFDHIGAELVELHGKFETVSKEVLLLKNEIGDKTKQLSEKIGDETKAISGRIEEFRNTILEKVEVIFERKFSRIVGVLIGAFSVLYAGVTFLQTKSVTPNVISFIALTIGLAILLITFVISRKSRD